MGRTSGSPWRSGAVHPAGSPGPAGAGAATSASLAGRTVVGPGSACPWSTWTRTRSWPWSSRGSPSPSRRQRRKLRPGELRGNRRAVPRAGRGRRRGWRGPSRCWVGTACRTPTASSFGAGGSSPRGALRRLSSCCPRRRRGAGAARGGRGAGPPGPGGEPGRRRAAGSARPSPLTWSRWRASCQARPDDPAELLGAAPRTSAPSTWRSSRGPSSTTCWAAGWRRARPPRFFEGDVVLRDDGRHGHVSRAPRRGGGALRAHGAARGRAKPPRRGGARRVRGGGPARRRGPAAAAEEPAPLVRARGGSGPPAPGGGRRPRPPALDLLGVLRHGAPDRLREACLEAS